MKHQLYNPNFQFYKEPCEFDNTTEKSFLQYCLGATLYMPGNKDIRDAIIERKWPGLTSMVMCFEDAIKEEQVGESEQNVINVLNGLVEALKTDRLQQNRIPLFFIRVRNIHQFKDFTEKLSPEHFDIITGFVFPKLTAANGYLYLTHLKLLNERSNSRLYGMPILESKEIAFKETRAYELAGIKSLLKPFQEYILNVRVGATDFSSLFGVRRGIDYTIYDIGVVRDCLVDILNYLNRGSDYVISAPVWEYFLVDEASKFKEIAIEDINNSLFKREVIVNEATDGLLREVIIDKANGFVGKTVIHPSHIQYVNAMQAVTKEEYCDAVQIMETKGGVVKSSSSNKMNEISPHRSWAKKIVNRARAYGVIDDESCYLKLFSV